MTVSPQPILATPLTELRGVGSERAAQLARLKLFTLADLLWHRPRRYEDRRHTRDIAQLAVGEAATVRGKVVALGLKRFRRGAKSVFELILDDGTARLHCRWWNLPFMQNYFRQADDVFVYGKPHSLKPRTIDHPETEVVESGEDSSIHINRIAPIYRLTEGLPQRWLRGFLWQALAQCEDQVGEPWPGDLLPDLPARGAALRQIHFPNELHQIEPARARLALDEFIELQLAMQRRRQNLQAHAKAFPCRGDNRLIKPFLARLGFPLTGAQTRVLRELRHDLGGAFPMRRLLQGDVGSGKTAVAACSALMALESGFGVALMAPTAILAEQHYQNFNAWLAPLGVPVELHTSHRKTRKGRQAEAEMEIQPGLPGAGKTPSTPSLAIGTHALIESGVDLEKLGLVIIDEQHKFGVAQREQLVRKGRYPHLLVMTATPIPRTLGLTLYGDLDISVIDALPPGRGTVKTFVRTPEKLPKVWEFLRQKLSEGRQAYVVYPRVEDSAAGSVKAVTRELERIGAQVAPYRVGLLHGRLRAEAKEAVMIAFRRCEIHVLLATSIIEVGVDVPNATILLVENAEQFGLAQLHQLRGRIGRGGHDSFCILVADVKTPEARQRLRVLEETNDGFRIAEADLELRGPGDLLGQDQSGLPALRFGNLAEDGKLVERARALARQMLSSSRGQAAK